MNEQFRNFRSIMPSGAKKRKALKKKKQQESIGTSTNNKGFNGDNLHGTHFLLFRSILFWFSGLIRCCLGR